MDDGVRLFRRRLQIVLAVVVVEAVAYMFTPAVATLVVEGLFKESEAKTRLGISFRLNGWFLVGLLAPAVLALLSSGFDLPPVFGQLS